MRRFVHLLFIVLGALNFCPADAAATGSDSVLAQRLKIFADGNLRGFTLADLQQDGTEIYSEQDYVDLVATGANVVRMFLHFRKCDGCQQYGFPEKEINYAERVLARGEKLGFRVVVSVLPLPGFGKSDYWENTALKDDIAGKWGHIASRLRGFGSLLAYDLINEPVVPDTFFTAAKRAAWAELALAITRRVRAVDPDTPIMIEPVPWAFPESFRNLEPLPVDGLVYSFHFYTPREFTHQGLQELSRSRGVSYPQGKWNKRALSDALQPVRDFSRKFGIPVFVGEFSCVRWAPEGSCARYVRDVIELFEDERWGWAYLGWRGYQGWDAELNAEIPMEQKKGRLPEFRRLDAPVISVLRDYMRRNAKTPGPRNDVNQ